MPTTPNRGYQYPALTDQPNGPLQLQTLAVEIDEDLAENLPLVATGTVTVTVGTANTPASASVSFPVGRFTGNPVVTLAIYGSGVGNIVTGVGVTNISSTGCTVWANRQNTGGGTVQVGWIAVQSN